MPGPAAQACTRPAPSMDSPGAAGSMSAITTSGQCWRTAERAAPLEASRTMPAPPWMALPVASTAAPGKRSLPASTPSTPRRYLSDSAVGLGSSAATSAACSARAAGSPSQGPSPMSASSTVPAWLAPGSMSRPGFQVPKVTVTSARMAAPATTPVSASTPLGRSTATTMAPSWRARSVRSASSAAGGLSPPRPPMPSSPSMIRSARSMAARSSAGPMRPPARRRAAAACS